MEGAPQILWTSRQLGGNIRCKSVETLFDGPVQAEATEDKRSHVEATSCCQSSQPVQIVYGYGALGLSIYWRLSVYVIFRSCVQCFFPCMCSACLDRHISSVESKDVLTKMLELSKLGSKNCWPLWAPPRLDAAHEACNSYIILWLLHHGQRLFWGGCTHHLFPLNAMRDGEIATLRG